MQHAVEEKQEFVRMSADAPKLDRPHNCNYRKAKTIMFFALFCISFEFHNIKLLFTLRNVDSPMLANSIVAQDLREVVLQELW